jgi:kynurenine formamidase
VRRALVLAAAVALASAAYAVGATQGNRPAHAQAPPAEAATDLWTVYSEFFAKARYIDLTHTVHPTSVVWKGFGFSKFEPAVDPESGQPYTYDKAGFEATRYTFATDQLGTQLDPPAHWAPEYPAIDELPATYALRPLLVISIVSQVRKKADYKLTVADIKAWEKDNGRIPAGSVVMVRSDWSKKWTDDPEKAKALAADPKFPGVSLPALEFLHLRRHILFHGHEPLDTDNSPDLAGESWLMHHGYTQAEGVDNLDDVPQTGCLLSIGYPKFKGGLGGYARYVAICPPDSPHGAKVSSKDAPLRRFSKKLHWDTAKGFRVR